MKYGEDDLEQLLGKATPLPCSVDSMQLMFDAGQEQQKRKGRGLRRLLWGTSLSSCVLLCISLVLAGLQFRLAEENSQLMAKLDVQGQVVNRLQLAQQGAENESPKSLTVPKSESKDEFLVKQSGKDTGTVGEPDEDESSLRFRQIANQIEMGWESVLLHGVSLRPEDEYRTAKTNVGTDYDLLDSIETTTPSSRFNLGAAGDFFSP